MEASTMSVINYFQKRGGIMKKSIFVFLLIAMLLTSLVSAEIIIINESEQNLYALESTHLSGDLDNNYLNIIGGGEVISGKNVKIYLFGPADDILVEDLYVNNEKAAVSFDGDGYYFVADTGRFSFNGKLTIRTIGQLNLYIPGPMNALTFDLTNGYAINGDRYGLYQEYVTVQRTEDVSMLVDGAFRFTYSDRNTFYYSIDFQAFGDSLGSYTIPLENGEEVLQVTGALDWSVQGNNLIVELKSSRANVGVSGVFDSHTLYMPLEGQHQMVIESDPEKKLSLWTSAKEQDLSEAEVYPEYNNARVFLATDYDTFDITVEDLDLLASLSASVSHAENRFAVTEKGSLLAEVNYDYANTGVDYLEFDIGDATPLYAATGYEPVKLTAEDEKLLLSLPKTEYGDLDLVYFTTISPLGLFSVVDIFVAKTDMPITEATTTVYLPGDYFVVETFGAPGGSELPGLSAILLFVILIGALAYFTVKKCKFIVAYLLFAVGLLYFNMWLFILLLAVTLILLIKQHIDKTKLKWVFIGAGILVVVGLLVVGAIGLFGSLFSGMGATSGSYYDDYAYDYAYEEEAMVMSEAAPMAAMKSIQRIGGDMDMYDADEGAISVPTKEGVLPVKLDLPTLGKSVTVTNHLVTPENPVEISVFVVASWLKYVFYLIALLAGLCALKTYKGCCGCCKPKGKKK
jgi:hypothetical protein